MLWGNGGHPIRQVTLNDIVDFDLSGRVPEMDTPQRFSEPLRRAIGAGGLLVPLRPGRKAVACDQSAARVPRCDTARTLSVPGFPQVSPGSGPPRSPIPAHVAIRSARRGGAPARARGSCGALQQMRQCDGGWPVIFGRVRRVSRVQAGRDCAQIGDNPTSGLCDQSGIPPSVAARRERGRKAAENCQKFDRR